MKNELVRFDEDDVYTTTRIVAIKCKVEHLAVLHLVRKYIPDLNEVGLSKLRTRHFKTTGRIGTEYLLDESQVTFLIMLMNNSKRVIAFKKQIMIESLAGSSPLLSLGWEEVI